MAEVKESMPDFETEILSPSLWDRWSLRDGTNAAPEPERFRELTENIPKRDVPQMAMATVRYAFERSGLLLTPEQLSKPLQKLGAVDEIEEYKIIDSFLEYCDLAEEVAQIMEDANNLCSKFSFDQLRKELPATTHDAEELAPMKIIKAMHRSDDKAFERIGNVTKSHSAAILRVMWGWERGRGLPQPENPLNPVS